MAQIRLTTTGTLSPVTIEDLGSVDFTHPTTNSILFDTAVYGNPFTTEELKDSGDLQAAIVAGQITISDDLGNNIPNIRDFIENMGVGTAGPQPIIVLTSTDNSTIVNQATGAILDWDVETEKDNGFTHSTSVNSSRITVDNSGTYQIKANIRMLSTGQRCQFVTKVVIDGVTQPQPFGSSYIRNSGNASDYWTCTVSPPPIKLTAGQYVEIKVNVESQNTITLTGTFQGSESSFSIVNLKGEKGDTGNTGAPGVVSNAANVGAGEDVFKTLNGSNLDFKTLTAGSGINLTSTTNEVEISATGGGGGVQFYQQLITATNSVSHSANTGNPTDVPSLSLTVAQTGSYIVYGSVAFDNLNLDNSGIELAFAINNSTTSTPWNVSPMAKKKKYNGSQGTWGNVSLTAGQTITLRMSTGGSSADLVDRKLYIATWV